MYLKKFALINYKSCQGLLLDIHKDDPNTFIGINDAGKTAILKAVGLLLEAKQSINVASEARNSSDISNTPLLEEEYNDIFSSLETTPFPYSPGNAVFVAEFCLEDGETDEAFMENASPQLKWAIESSGSDSVFVLKQFDNSTPGGRYFPHKKFWQGTH